MSKEQALDKCTEKAISDFSIYAGQKADASLLTTYITFATSIFNLQRQNCQCKLKNPKEKPNYEVAVEHIKIITNCLKNLKSNDTSEYEECIAILETKDQSKKLELSDERSIKVGSEDCINYDDNGDCIIKINERSAFRDDDDEGESISLSEMLSDVEESEDSTEGTSLNLVNIPHNVHYEEKGEDNISSYKSENSDAEELAEEMGQKEFLEEIAFHDGDLEAIKEEQEEIKEEREESIEGAYENEPKNEDDEQPMPKVLILGSAEKRYKRGQKKKQNEQNLKIDPSFVVDFDESYKLLYEDLLKISSQVVHYILRTSSTSTSGRATLVDNILTIEIDLFEFKKSYDLDKTNPAVLLNDLLFLINECDVHRAIKYSESLMKTVQKSKKDRVKQILMEMRDNVREMPSLETERHKIKTKIAALIKSLSKMNRVEDDEESNEKMANSVSAIIREISNFLSFDNKTPCINHCYKVMELFIVPALIEEYDLKMVLEKKYKVQFIIVEHGSINEEEVRRFIKEYC